MKKIIFTKLIFLFFVVFVNPALADFDKLTKRKYEKFKDEKAVVIFGVNWGRNWGCAGLENAQLQKLSFTRMDSNSGSLTDENINLKTPSKLFADDVFKPNAIIVNPGEYALSGFDVKLAKSVSNIKHMVGDQNNLFENGRPIGGTFNVQAGEVVYIGEFGLDCAYEPIPWRYYIEKEDFESYIDGFRKKHKFIGDKKVVYRLFQTEKFGQ